MKVKFWFDATARFPTLCYCPWIANGRVNTGRVAWKRDKEAAKKEKEGERKRKSSRYPRKTRKKRKSATWNWKMEKEKAILWSSPSPLCSSCSCRFFSFFLCPVHRIIPEIWKWFYYIDLPDSPFSRFLASSNIITLFFFFFSW